MINDIRVEKWLQRRKKEQGKWVGEQKGMQEWGIILRWNKLSMWEEMVVGWKSPLEENRLRERAMRWRGKHPWNNARLGNKRERGLKRSKRWAIVMGFCLWRRHWELVLRRMFVFRCLEVFLNHRSEWMLKWLVLSLISNKVTNQWCKCHKWWQSKKKHSISLQLCLSNGPWLLAPWLNKVTQFP